MKAEHKNALVAELVGENNIVHVDVVTLASLLWEHNNRFFRVAWCSNQNKRLKKKGAGLPYKTQDVRKCYVATMRNNYNYRNRVAKLMSERGDDVGDWQPKERTWGGHLDGTPFVEHENTGDDQLSRLYGHFLPVRYYTVDGLTGYYADGEKQDDAKMKALEYAKKKPTDALTEARQDAHPVNARLDDVLVFKIGGQWYTVDPPTPADIQALAASAIEYSKKVELETAAAA